jgi:hypothetical protein
MPKQPIQEQTEPEDTGPVVYKIETKEQKDWNKDEGRWEFREPYSSPAYVKYGGKVSVRERYAETEDPEIALEFLDGGATVTPDPRPVLQEKHALELLAEYEVDKIRGYELNKYVRSTNDWRKAHGFPPLSIPMPEGLPARPPNPMLESTRL